MADAEGPAPATHTKSVARAGDRGLEADGAMMPVEDFALVKGVSTAHVLAAIAAGWYEGDHSDGAWWIPDSALAADEPDWTQLIEPSEEAGPSADMPAAKGPPERSGPAGPASPGPSPRRHPPQWGARTAGATSAPAFEPPQTPAHRWSQQPAEPPPEALPTPMLRLTLEIRALGRSRHLAQTVAMAVTLIGLAFAIAASATAAVILVDYGLRRLLA